MFKKISIFIIVAAFILLGSISAVFAQRNVDYRTLAQQNQQQNIFISHFSLPDKDDNTLKFITSFKISYSFLPFKKLDNPEGENTFFSSTGLSIEVFKATKRIPEKDSRKLSINGLSSAGRAFWKDTAYAVTYEETQSNGKFIEGYMEVELEPGLYNFMLKLNRGSENNEQNSRIRQVQIPPYGTDKDTNVILANTITQKQGTTSLALLNYGSNARYGKDYFALIQIPNYDSDKKYAVSINKIEATEEDTTKLQEMYSQQLKADQIYTGIKPVMDSKDGSPNLILKPAKNGFAYALLEIPNSTFPNALYRMQVTAENSKKPIVQSVIRSFWPEIPTSLLNLDVAIEMTKFIVSEKALKDLSSGSEKEKEKKLRAFWKSKDPTPNTEFNELMTEYYNRIDYVYEKFTTVNYPGFETDQGQIYIKYGEPENIERKFPSGEPAVEIWSYGNRKFVFKATSGFGDFQLVSK